ncbi:ATP-binding protein [Magnetospirillum sp. 15-1]|uniref:ATP-binding protein n=1 Tax=Magnetospirillum sp. 15-1 TaxID=1979370 RepID=UPI000BBBF183|nr:ATP-binding protein [Magnetospirillum sp. 15-1]
MKRSTPPPAIINRAADKRGLGRFGRLAAAGLLPLRTDEHGRTLVLFEGAGTADVGDILCPPAAWAIDLDCASPDHGLDRLPARLLVRASTVATVHHDIVGMVVEALIQRLPRLDSIGIDIRLALQEAVSNAVMHGNLCLDGRLRSSRDGLAAFTQAMQRRLADPRFGRRPVTVAVDWNHTHMIIRVEDRGRGFKPPAISLPVEPKACSGRGIGQIRALCQRVSFTNGGRRITMRFCLPADDAAQPTT